MDRIAEAPAPTSYGPAYGPEFIGGEPLARFRAYRADMARYQAAVTSAENQRLMARLGDQDAVVIEDCSKSSLWELAVTIIGKTAEAVEAAQAAYLAKHSGHLPGFNNITPWNGIYRLTGTRWEGR